MPTTETHFELTANDGVTVESHRWQGATQRAVIQLAHGMGEHSLRYRHLADALVQAGYVVYSNCLLYTSPSPRDGLLSRMPSSA